MGLRTIHLKLHNPGKAKRELINKAFINYNNAFNYLLSTAHADMENIEKNYVSKKGTYSALGLSKWISRELAEELNRFDIQPFKDSLKLDFGMALASHLTQKKTNPKLQFPVFKDGPVTWEDKLRPIYFCRYDTKRCFSLLWDSNKDKFFAKLFLMNSVNGRERESLNFSRTLTYISDNSDTLKAMKKETFIIAPLSFGKWQLDMLRKAVEVPEILRTARLIIKKNEYYLGLSIDLPEEEKIQTETYLGVCRGIDNSVNYTVTDNRGSMQLNGCLDLDKYSNAAEKSRNIHILANRIVELAHKYKSMTVLQNLTERGDKLSWNDGVELVKPVMGCKQYNELARLLQYRLPQRGLPEPAVVSSVDIFHRCSICGCNTKKNRFSKNMFICTACGASSKLDSLGSLNLSAKLIKYKSSPLKLKAYRTTEGIYLNNELIGLNIYVPRNENPLDYLKLEIERISSDLEEYVYSKKLNSREVKGIINKLVSNNFTNIEIN